jgi:LemA protein
MDFGVIILLVVIVAIVLFVIGIYNGLIGRRNRVDEALAQIQVQLKRRHDLIPNLVEAVKGYASHENKTFREVTEARASAMKATGVEDVSKAESALGGALGNLRVVAEQYPELRATENFQQLQRQLSELEDEIQASRRIYNSNVQTYNTRIQQFPASIVANQGGFTAKPFFEIGDAAEREAPQVSFSQPPG